MNSSTETSTPPTDAASTPTISTTDKSDSPLPPASSDATSEVVEERKPQVVRDAWAAGFIDGEGHFSIERRSDPHGHLYYYPRLKVTNTNRWVLECLKFTYGGAISTTGRKKSGQKRVYRWSIGGEGADMVAKRVRPYLLVKAEQASLFRRFIRYRAVRRTPLTSRMQTYKRQMHKLNRRGV